MTVMVLTACPSGVKGDLSRWLLEIAPGVFVGRISARLRERLWARVISMLRDGRAIMVYSARNEQHFSFEVFQPDWKVVDCDGIELIKRPRGTDDATLTGVKQKGWSSASKRHKARRYSS
ncbi:type I-E CRISPR-associated endoribonuclease Cas2e [Collinsella tanakaei]|uniref:type I-E CRISPR-associated endoribonuclease Cas2e n=1 Tax=Collinsella tanakaei TaxID=626935 RepID=UPI00195C72C8|nr:type I-E CRISPR-associated endoribonuclease Cas2 [Collinsella tanakaei]